MTSQRILCTKYNNSFVQHFFHVQLYSSVSLSILLIFDDFGTNSSQVSIFTRFCHNVKTFMLSKGTMENGALPAHLICTLNVCHQHILSQSNRSSLIIFSNANSHLMYAKRHKISGLCKVILLIHPTSWKYRSKLLNHQN